MLESLTDALCTHCGLCCDGSLFAEVELEGEAESTRLESLGLDVESDDSDAGLLVLPCGALCGTRCSIYVHRPRTCRTFECRLLKDAGRGEVSVEQALVVIGEAREKTTQVRALLAKLPGRPTRLPLRERCAEALAAPPAAGAAAQRTRVRLEAAMSELDWLLERTFLAPPKKGVGKGR